jgi:hypothetical protein
MTDPVGTDRDESERSFDRFHISGGHGMSGNVKGAFVKESLYLGHKMSSQTIPTQPELCGGVGLEPTSPCGQRFSSVWPGVLAGPAYFYLMLFEQVSDETTS